ncbi:MAG TPA: cytochrome c [Gemmatimonadaceae bacterium]|nr:cytochrome c [Gemmatimonadaceae bacterium]
MKVLLVIVGLGVLGSLVMFFVITSRGISARAEPGAFETAIARSMRSFAVPRGERSRKNPVPYSDEVFAAGKEHWADHCASCHGNDGSGETSIGLGMYPKPPDMRLPPTQSLSDGEIFYIIENGIRLTGMPAWGDGTPETAVGSWHLVHFVRALPKLTATDLEEMEGINPRSVGDVRQEEEMRRFLDGGGEAPAAKPSPSHRHGGH